MKMVGNRCDNPTTASTTDAAARPRPVRMTRMSRPRNTRLADSESENENSPAMVDKMLPPRMSKCGSRTNTNAPMANR